MKIASTTAFAILASVSATYAQERDWSGTWLNFTAGSSRGVVDTAMQDDQFCGVDGTPGLAECSVGADFATVSTSAGDHFASVAGTVTAVTSAGVGGTGFNLEMLSSNNGTAPIATYPVADVVSGRPFAGGLNAQSIPDSGSTSWHSAGNYSYAYADGATGQLAALSVSDSAVDGVVTGNGAAIALVNVLDFASEQTISNSTYGGGVHFDRQFDSGVVAGLAGKFFIGNATEWTEEADFGAGSLTLTRRLSTDAIASAQGRLGYALGDLLPFLTGGVAVGRFTVNSTLGVGALTLDPGLPANLIAVSDEATTYAVGGVIGAGFSYFVADDVALGVEGNYYVFDNDLVLNGADNIHIGNQLQLSASLSFRLP